MEQTNISWHRASPGPKFTKDVRNVVILGINTVVAGRLAEKQHAQLICVGLWTVRTFSTLSEPARYCLTRAFRKVRQQVSYGGEPRFEVLPTTVFDDRIQQLLNVMVDHDGQMIPQLSSTNKLKKAGNENRVRKSLNKKEIESRFDWLAEEGLKTSCLAVIAALEGSH